MAYDRINWQNEPSEATALNDVNLNKMDSAIYELDGKATTTETAITNLQDGKVDKVNGKGLSQVDNVTVTQHVAYGTVVSTIKTYGQDGTEVTSQVCNGIVVDSALSNSSTNPVQNKVVKSAIDGKSTVAISDTLATGTTLANITIDGTTTAIKGSDIEVDEELSSTSTNPVENKAIYDALNNLLPSKTVSGNPISISDASGLNAKALTVTMNPIQDLHGYDNPWVGGAGKNIMPSFVAGTYEVSGLKAVVNENGLVTVTGTKNASGSVSIDIPFEKSFDLSSSTYIHVRNSYANANIALDWGVGGWYFSMTPVNRIIAPSNLTGITRLRLYHASTLTEELNYTLQLSIETTNTVTEWTPYSNICPISGRTEGSVKRTGKNQCDTSAFGGVSHYTVNTDGSITVNSSDTRSWSTVSEIPLKAGTYTVSKSGTTGTSDIRLSTEEFNTGHIFTTSFTFTLATDGSVKIKLAYGGVTYPQTYTLQIESGSTATSYEPYTAETKTHQYSDTIYGGSDDFVNGGLSNTHYMYEPTEVTQASVSSQTDTVVVFDLTLSMNNLPTPKANTLISNRFSMAIPSGQAGRCVLSATHMYLVVAKSELSTYDRAGLNEWITNNPTQLCYELATPTTISTSAEEITLLKGNNVLSTNADDMELKYSVSLDSLLPTTTRTLAKSPIVEEPKEETDETEEQR